MIVICEQRCTDQHAPLTRICGRSIGAARDAAAPTSAPAELARPRGPRRRKQELQCDMPRQPSARVRRREHVGRPETCNDRESARVRLDVGPLPLGLPGEYTSRPFPPGFVAVRSPRTSSRVRYSTTGSTRRAGAPRARSNRWQPGGSSASSSAPGRARLPSYSILHLNMKIGHPSSGRLHISLPCLSGSDDFMSPQPSPPVKQRPGYEPQRYPTASEPKSHPHRPGVYAFP